jgi:hypothetical protein
MKTSWIHLRRIHLPIVLSQKWAVGFKRDRENIGDDKRPGRPKETINDETADAMHDLGMCDRRQDL